MIKVLIVDDSAFMRGSISRMLKSDPDIEVIGQAANGIEALDKIEKLNPDVITLDIEMPKMDGIATLEEIMKRFPKPVLMVSSLTDEGADATLRSLELGALDYMPKYHEGSAVFAIVQEELVNKIKVIAKRAAFVRTRASCRSSIVNPIKSSALGTVLGKSQPASNTSLASSLGSSSRSSVSVANTLKPPLPVKMSGRPKRDIVAIGVSTGGPPAVQKVLSQLPADFPACILIAQHMPSAFTSAFAKRLDTLCKINVKEAVDGDRLISGTAFVCPGGQHISIVQKGALPLIKISSDPPGELYKPAANILNETAAVLATKVVGLTMTGMGSDGVKGTKILKEKGGYILAQSESTCVVYGMPRAVVDANLADEIVDLDDIPSALQKALYR